MVVVAARWLLWPENAPEQLIEFLHRHAEHVLIVGVVAESDIGDGLVVSYLDSIGYVPKPDSLFFLKMKEPQKLRNAEQRLLKTAARYENVTVIPMLDLFGRGKDCMVAVGDETLYLDDDHLTQFGADLGFQRIQSTLQSLLDESIEAEKTNR